MLEWPSLFLSLSSTHPSPHVPYNYRQYERFTGLSRVARQGYVFFGVETSNAYYRENANKRKFLAVAAPCFFTNAFSCCCFSLSWGVRQCAKRRWFFVSACLDYDSHDSIASFCRMLLGFEARSGSRSASSPVLQEAKNSGRRKRGLAVIAAVGNLLPLSFVFLLSPPPRSSLSPPAPPPTNKPINKQPRCRLQALRRRQAAPLQPPGRGFEEDAGRRRQARDRRRRDPGP